MPRKNTFMQPYIPSLFFYHTDISDAPAHAIYTLKHTKYSDLYDFISIELSMGIADLLSELEINASDCIITYIPRTAKGLRKNGFDQSELLAKMLCDRMGVYAALPLLKRRGGKEQKKLSTAERKRNAESSFSINSSLRGIHIKGVNSIEDVIRQKTVILVDDVITSGASMAQGIKVLRGAGAKTVICAAISRCEMAKKAKSKKISDISLKNDIK